MPFLCIIGIMEFALKEALQLEGCPICAAVEREFGRALWWFKKEGYHDINTLKNLKENPHLCKRHAEMIQDMESNLSVTFEFLIEEDLKLLRELSSVHSIKTKRIIAKENGKGCRFCMMEESIETRAITLFARLLSDEGFREIFKKSQVTLCRKHLFKTLELLPKGSGEFNFLVDEGIKRLSGISREISEFFKRQDYRSVEKKPPHTETAWQKALKFYRGEA